jgi:hypothetical protein
MNRNSTFLTTKTMDDDKLSSVKKNHQFKMKCKKLDLKHKPLFPKASQVSTQLSDIHEEYCSLQKKFPA